MKKKQGDDYRLDLTLSLEQDQTMTPLEASASLSQGFEAVDSPRTRAASFRGGPQGPPQRLLLQSKGPGWGNVWHRGHCNTDEEVEMETLQVHFHHRSSQR